MAIFINAYMRRATSESITLYSASGAVVPVSDPDNVRIKIGRSGEAPLLDITSDAGNSRCTDANPTVLTLSQADLVAETIKPGVYDVEVSVVDATDSSKIKHAESGVFSLHDTPLGGLS